MAEQFSLAYLAVAGTEPEAMIDIAAAIGYDFVSLRLTKVTPDEEVPALLGDPVRARSVRRYAEDAGVGILDVELVRVGPDGRASDFAEFMERTADLGAQFVLAQLPDADRERAVANFVALCRLAAPLSLTVGLEFLPWTATADLAAAVDIVRRAGQPNGGIVIDTLHFCRSASTVDQLRVLPPGLFPFVQLCDAPRETPRTEEGLIHAARAARNFPGEAGLDLRPLVDALPKVPYSLEIPNELMRSDVGTEEFARRALNATKRFFARSEILQVPW